SVALSTPGPVRWKLCAVDRSCTSTSYVPAGRLVTGFPFEASSLIVGPGPTGPLTTGSPTACTAPGRPSISPASPTSRTLMSVLRARAPRGFLGGGTSDRPPTPGP